MKSTALWSLVLLTAGGCASTTLPTAGEAPPWVTTTEALASADHHGDEAEHWDDDGSTAGGDIGSWIPELFLDLFDIIDADIGAGYGFGAHVKATNWLQLGLFDHADFRILGIERDIFYGNWHYPHEVGEDTFQHTGDVWDVSVAFGVGFGASATVRIWEIFDAVSSLIGFGYWSLDQD